MKAIRKLGYYSTTDTVELFVDEMVVMLSISRPPFGPVGGLDKRDTGAKSITQHFSRKA